MSSIGERIKELRKNHNFTQNELGTKICVSEKVISKWENGETLPSVEMIPKIADVFAINTDELFCRHHNNFTDIESLVSDYMYSLPRNQSFITAHRLYSYIICGMQKREMADSGCYTDEQTAEICQESKQLIDKEDERLQYDEDAGNAAWCYNRQGRRICMMQSGIGNAIGNYSSMQQLFSLLAREDIDKVLDFFFNEASGKFTKDYIAKKTSASAETIKTFLGFLFELKKNTNEAIIEKSIAVIDGVETEIYCYYHGAFESILKSILLCADVLTEERNGFR